MIFSKILINWYSVNKRDLPWRNTTDPYHIWLSEIILQQTQVKQGLPYYDAFTAKYPSVFDLANAKEDDVLKLWQGLGYYSRARNLHHTAKHIAFNLKGVFPVTYKELLTLKGVGDYTASAIASICFDEVTPVVDGNVYRVLSRYFGVSTAINSSKGAKEFKVLAQKLIDKKQPAEFNQAIMEFGATQCKPKSPDCSVCPFNKDCMAFNMNLIGELPVKIKSAKAKKKYFNFLVFISDDGETLLEQRVGKGIWQNLYQFPLVETEHLVDYKGFKTLIKNNKLLVDQDFELTLYNKDAVIHKLSHQHLYTKFWIVRMKKLPKQGVSTSVVRDFAVPILIGDFIEVFNF